MKLILSLLLLLTFATGLVSGQDFSNKPPRAEVVQTAFILHQPPFSQCHASTLTELSDGSLMVAFFGGSHESANDVKIWSVTGKNDSWSDPVILADGKIGDTIMFPCWNPVLYKSRGGTLYLFYKVGRNPREWFGMMKTSEDEGKSWSGAVRLPDGVLGPIKNKPMELPDGKLLCPSSTESTTEWKVRMETFDPVENSWTVTKVDPENPFQVIQPTLLKNGYSGYRILCRSKSNAIITSTSDDQGKTWSNLTAINLPNPNSGIDAVTLTNGANLLVYNPLLSGKDWVNGRNRLNLAWSPNGTDWTDILVLENEESGEFSYPAVIQSEDGLVHITYTYNRIQVRYWEIKF